MKNWSKLHTQQQPPYEKRKVMLTGGVLLS